LGQTTLKKVMRLNRRVHLAPQRPVELAIRAPREGPFISKHPFEHAYIVSFLQNGYCWRTQKDLVKRSTI